MIRTFVAALALACAFSTHAFAFAPDYAAEPSRVPVGLLLLGASVLLMFVANWSRLRIVVTVCLMTLLGAGFAFSAEAVTTPAVVIPWGDYIVSAGTMLTAILLPVLVGLVSRAVYQVAPWARLVLTQARLEQMTKAVTDYALNAVAGAAKGQTLTIPVGSAVIAKGVQRAVDVVPAKVLAAAGGPEGVAELIFRTLKLEDGANAANTLAPAQAALGGK